MKKCFLYSIFFAITILFFQGCNSVGKPHYDSFLEEALSKAKDNRDELEKVLEHYKNINDTLKYKAACFLICNMPGKCFVNLGWKNSKDEDIDFEVLNYNSYEEASAAFKDLEKKHGEIKYQSLKTVYDIEVITADFLINNIDFAFDCWENSPWTKDMPFDVFCERVLPYRATNEQLDNSWRMGCRKLFPGLEDSFPNPDDLQKVQKYLRKEMDNLIQFSTLYYLHPTDQSFSEMMSSGKGRCEDMSNLIGFMTSAFALPMAKDYTPYWAKSDNNHAWEVMLDKKGKSIQVPKYEAAKVYRKNYSYNYDSLYYRVDDKIEIPRWLGSTSATDVTTEYVKVSDVVIEPDFSETGKQEFIYICVFNSGKWRAIHWAEVKDNKARFTDMGLNICYIAAAYINEDLVPVSYPFILDKNKNILFLDDRSSEQKTYQINSMSPNLKNVDTGIIKKYMLEQGTYIFYAWENNKWKEIQRFVLEVEGEITITANENVLYWITRKHTKDKARIFTVEDNIQVWW